LEREKNPGKGECSKRQIPTLSKRLYGNTASSRGDPREEIERGTEAKCWEVKKFGVKKRDGQHRVSQMRKKSPPGSLEKRKVGRELGNKGGRWGGEREIG